MRTPVRSDYFSRLVFSGRSPCILMFRVRFPGRTPDAERRWLKAHGYEFSGRAWNRVDRKTSRMTYAQRSEHTRRVQARRRAARQGAGT